jgi:hypothetical protein
LDLTTDARTVVVKPDQLTWMDIPTIQGDQMAILTGDPARAETVAMRFKFPANHPAPALTSPRRNLDFAQRSRWLAAKGASLTLRSSSFRHIVMAENAGALSFVGEMRREGGKAIPEFVGSDARTIDLNEKPEEILAVRLGEQRGS